MSASIIQTRRSKEKEQAAASEEKEVKAVASDVDTVEAVDAVEGNVVQVMVQDEGGEEVAHAVPIHVEAKQDSHVQILASGSVCYDNCFI